MKVQPASPLWPSIVWLALVVATALFAIPGPLTWDSGTYHLMVRGLYQTGGFFIPNAYDELASPLLAVGQTMVKHGHIVSQYPELYTLISLPFYALFGFRGLMVLNAVAFGGIIFLIWRMARWFSDHPHAPIAATGVYALATYAIEFTQSSYPHLTSTFLVFAAVWLLWGAALGKDDLPGFTPGWLRTVELRCAGAGLVFGVAIGVRLDSAFAGLALAVPFVTSRALGFRALLASGIGAMPPLAALAWINAVKFGEPLPFSYGRTGGGGNTDSLLVYAPVAGALALGFTLLCWHRYRPFRTTRWRIACLLAAVAAVLGLTPFGHRLLYGLFQIVVDLRVRPEIAEPALSRSAGGAVVYWGTVKKALLQSCPYLILIVLPAARGLASGSYGTRWLLWLVPAGFIGFYGYLAWHGSVGWNMRYVNPALPFLAMLASHEMLRVSDRIPMSRPLLYLAAPALWIIFVLLFFGTRQSLWLQEQIVLNGSLALAALLLILQLVEQLGPSRPARAARPVLAGALLVSLIWASALTFGIDYRTGAAVRAHFLDGARDIAGNVERDALIVTFQPDYVWPLLDSGKHPVIANESRGSTSGETAIELVERSLERRPVYWLTSPHGGSSIADGLRARGIGLELLLDAAPGRPYRLLRLTKGK